MAVTKLRSVPANPQTQVNTPANTASNDTRNIAEGRATLLSVQVDNMFDAPTSNTKMWLKVYDDVTDAWTPGTTAPVMIFPVPAAVASAAGVRGQGITTWHAVEGYLFDDGISVAASQEDGDVATAAPGEPVIVEFVFA